MLFELRRVYESIEVETQGMNQDDRVLGTGHRWLQRHAVAGIRPFPRELLRAAARAEREQCRRAQYTADALRALSLSNSSGAKKVVLLVRHGEALHNQDWRTHRDTRDPELTERGAAQAQGLADNPALLQRTLIVCSPMSRAIQTAAAIFGERPACRTCLCALHTERCSGGAPCNFGSPKAELVRRFPFVASWEGFDDLADGQWWPDPSDEAHDRWKTRRVPAFLAWLQRQPESRIVVVGHGAFFHDPRLAGRMLSNCEVAVCLLSDSTPRD